VDRFTPYEYLAFLLPGGTVVWTLALALGQNVDLGAGEFAVVLGLAFVVGHALAAVASWGEPIFWGDMPGGRTDPLWGVFGRNGPIDEERRPAIEHAIQARLKSVDGFPRLHRLGYTRLQQLGLDGHLQVLNQQIGFYRNMVVALVVAAAVQIGSFLVLSIAPTYSLPAVVVVEAGGALLFIYRYKRFWAYFGAAVLDGILALPVEVKQK